MTRTERTVPRYRLIADDLAARISSGALRPGEMLPSEADLGADYGVSQGTARMAVSLLEARGLLDRHQGRGTFVARETPERALFHFFRLRDAAGRPVVPELEHQDVARRRATASEARALRCRAVVELDRLRVIGGVRAARERVVLPLPHFAATLDGPPPPNALYPHYQAVFGVTVAQAEEALTLLVAPGDGHEGLNVRAGGPLLRVERVARNPTGAAVELRRCIYAMDGLRYDVALR